MIRESQEIELDLINDGNRGRCKNKLPGMMIRRSKSVRVPKNSIKFQMKKALVMKAKKNCRCKDEELNKRAQMRFTNLN